MIKSWAYDIEVLPNFFSITIIDLNDYLATFNDCVNEKGKPITLINKFKVSEIKDKLSNINKKVFAITDTNDDDLLPMYQFINGLTPYIDEDGNPVRNDMFGYNSMNYDKFMVAAFLMYFGNTRTTKELITKLYDTSKHIIEIQGDKERSRNDYLLKNLEKYKLPYIDIDIMRVFALNKVGKGVDNNGNTIYFGKSLKQTSINIQWYELLEHELPPISDVDKHFYNFGIYKSLDCDGLNRIIDKWDRYIIDDWIEEMLRYNANDVFIVCEMIRLNMDEIRLRYSISRAYKVDVLSSSRSDIADRLFERFYSEFSNLPPQQWKGKKTEHQWLKFSDAIFPFIKFQSEKLNNFLANMRKVKIATLGKKGFMEEVTIGNLVYTVATGGLHTQDIPAELRSKLIKQSPPPTGEEHGNNIWNNITDDSYIYVHYDIASFYPSLISAYNIAPAHLNTSVFVKLVTWLRDTRVSAKRSKESLIDGIPKNIFAEALKIVINSIYGKLGYEFGDIYDRLAVLKVTLNGQLMVMMCCEMLENAGIEIISANTDGIVAKVHKSKKKDFDAITNKWCYDTKLSADSEEYDCYITSNINNYIVRELNGKVSYKGFMNPYMHLKSLDKGYNMPIVAKAVSNYFLEDIPIMETLKSSNNILDFCKTQNIGKQFIVVAKDNKGDVSLQRNVRYYVSNTGCKLYKQHTTTLQLNGLAANELCTVINTLDDTPIEFRNINYKYYYMECMKIIEPIKLGINPNSKANPALGIKSGRAVIKKKVGMYQSLFD